MRGTAWCVWVGQYAAAAFVRRLLRHRQFDTEAKRLATVIRLSQRGLAVLIYVLFNTFFALLTQDEQIRCCENVARHLAPSSVFLIEAFVPDVARCSGKQAVRAVQVTSDEVRLDVTHWDPVTQHLMSQHVVLTEQGVRLFPVQLRYVWPAELDLMARLAGLHLRERWESWDRSGFTADSTKHISVYERSP